MGNPSQGLLKRFGLVQQAPGKVTTWGLAQLTTFLINVSLGFPQSIKINKTGRATHTCNPNAKAAARLSCRAAWVTRQRPCLNTHLRKKS